MLRRMTETFIQSQGLWCGRLDTMLLLKSSPNQNVFHIMCDDGIEAVNYEMVTDRDFNPVSLREK